MPDQSTLKRLVNILSDQIVDTYKAKTEEDISLVDLSLESVRKEAEEYEQASNNRKLARRLAIIVPLLFLGLLCVLLGVGIWLFGWNFNSIIPIIQVPLPVLLWSTLGSCVAILYRFNTSGDAELDDPLRWLFTRPLTGIVMGIVSYYVVLAGLLAIAPKEISSLTTTAPSLGATVIFWLVPFIASFSDRFADKILKTLIGRFGGDTKQDFNSAEIKFISSYLRSLAQETPKDSSNTTNHRPKSQLTPAPIQEKIVEVEQDTNVLPDAQV